MTEKSKIEKKGSKIFHAKEYVRSNLQFNKTGCIYNSENNQKRQKVFKYLKQNEKKNY